MACAIGPEELKRVKALGFLNNRGTDLFNGRILTINGKITAEQTAVIAEAAKKFGSGEVEFTTRLTVEVRGVHYQHIQPFREFIAQAGLETGGTGPLVRPVVSCKGTTCQYGLCDTFDLSEKIHRRFYQGYHTVRLPHKFKIAVGGCPNNCVKPTLNDLGIMGQMLPEIHANLCRKCKKCQVEIACPMNAEKLKDGIIEINRNLCNSCGRCIGACPFKIIEHGTPVFRMFIGGRWGKKIAHGRPLRKVFTSEDEVLEVVEKTILFFREQGRVGERLSDTIERIGMEEVEAQLLAGDLLARKQKIIDSELHLTGAAVR